MRRLRRFVGLPWIDQCLIAEAAFFTGLARLALVTIPFRWIAPWLGQHMAETPKSPRAVNQRMLERVQNAVRIASSHVPWKAQCLAQAIAATSMLRRRRMEGTIYLGIARSEPQTTIAHAWLRSGSTIVTGAAGGSTEELAVVSTFAFPPPAASRRRD